MNKLIFNIASLIACITFLLCSVFYVHVHLGKAHSQPEIIISDSFRFRFRTLQSEIKQLKQERVTLQSDTARIQGKYNAILTLINHLQSESEQRKELTVLLGSPDPKTKDINLQIVKGLQCCDMLENTKAQLLLSDSVSELKDTLISVQQSENNQYKSVLSTVLTESKAKDQAFTKAKSNLKAWRTATLVESLAIAITIYIYKISH